MRPTEAGAEIRERAKWDARGLGLGFRFPNDAGAMPDGRIWVYYASSFEFAKLLWINPDGEAQAPIDYPYRPSWLIAIDQDATAYLCGNVVQSAAQLGGTGRAGLTCRAHAPNPGEPVWEVKLDKGTTPNGGALVQGRLTTEDGFLYAIGDGQPANQ